MKKVKRKLVDFVKLKALNVHNKHFQSEVDSTDYSFSLLYI